MTNEEAINRLEEKLAHLEKMHTDLNQVVVALQMENADLKAQLHHLTEHILNHNPSLLAQLNEETPPPHY